jgi:hypothetical protein
MSEIEYFKEFVGATEKDVQHACRPGGPLDILFYRTKWEKCGLKVHRLFRWFMSRKYRCSCGGKFNFDSLTQLVWRTIVSPESTPSPTELREHFRGPDVASEEGSYGHN